MREEMQLTFFILIFCSYLQSSQPHPPDTKWRQSRYIIDNRRNALFLKKTFAPLYPQHEELSNKYRYNPVVYKRRPFPIDRYQKDLTVEASISEPKYYDKYNENSLPYNPYKIIQAIKSPIYETEVLERQKNLTNLIDPQNFIHDHVTTERRMTSEGTTEPAPSTEVESPTTTTTKTTTTTWEYKTEEGNQIDNNEKHVYETRIETVSYHQEVIFNPPKKENWYGDKPQPEENYEQSEENYEEEEKNYEEDEKNYEEPEESASEGEENQNKFGYVVEGRNYRKYRVEERTADGFIVGEYGVMSHNDGSLRGVRYTAEEGINPKLIYETLIKFLSL